MVDCFELIGVGSGMLVTGTVGISLGPCEGEVRAYCRGEICGSGAKVKQNNERRKAMFGCIILTRMMQWAILES